jgi:hypothetical protein
MLRFADSTDSGTFEGHLAAAMASHGLGVVLYSMGSFTDALAEITAANEYLTNSSESLKAHEVHALALPVLFAEDQSEMAAIATHLRAAGQPELPDMIREVARIKSWTAFLTICARSPPNRVGSGWNSGSCSPPLSGPMTPRWRSGTGSKRTK